MKQASIPALVLVVCALVTPARAGTIAPLWSDYFGDASSQQAYATAVDERTGRVAVAGTFQGSINFGSGNLTSAGLADAFLAVFEPSGALIAAKIFGDAGGNQYAYGVGFDGDGNVFLTGYFSSVINLGGSNLTSAGASDIFLARFDYALNHLASKRFGDASNQYPADLEVDASGNVYLTGYFQGGVDFGGGLLTSAGGNDVYVAKLNNSLSHTWSKHFGDAATQNGQGIAVDESGNVYLTGFFSGTVNFGAGNLTSVGGNDIFVAKFSSAGTHQWSARFGDANNHLGQKIAVTPAGDVFVVGHFTGTVNFGGSLLTSAGAEDAYIARFNTSGVHQWSQRFGDVSSQFAYDVDVDGTGVYVAGTLLGAANFGGGTLVSNGGRDAYLVKFDLAGTHVYGRLFGSTSDQYALSLDTGVGRVALTGYFNADIDLGAGKFTSTGSLDVFLGMFGTHSLQPVIQSVTDVGNDQGRQARVRFRRSGHDDAFSPDDVLAYEAYICKDVFPDGALADAAGGCDYVYVGSIPARAQDTYTMIVPTLADSTISQGDYNTMVYVVATKSTPSIYYFSNMAFGSSIDNLAPSAPSLLQFDQVNLSWSDPLDEDFKYFTVYGANAPDFGAATAVGYASRPVLDVSASPYAWFFVTATDFAGNEGPAAMLRVLTGIGGSPASWVLSLSAAPNPFNPSTAIRYTLPARARVVIDIFDAAGRRVAALLDAEKDAGAHSVAWDGVDTAGRAAGSGVYFARITAGGESRAYKLVLLK